MNLTTRRRRPDLPTRLVPLIAPERWKDPGAALQVLYEDAQARAIEVCDWYMADRLGRKRASRILRGLALVLAAAGGLVPLANVTVGQSVSGWGYLLLALAGVCFGFDRYLGLSSGWMRDVMTAQRVQRRLQDFQFAWIELNAADACPGQVQSSPLPYLELLREFARDLSDLVIGETGDWVAEFQTGLQQLESATSKK
jgi:hypothetical protein